MRRTYKYRLYPSQAQDAALHAQVNEACRLYSAALDERRSAWKMNHVSRSYYTQSNQLKAIRAAGDCGVANFSACQDVLRRVDKTFRAFFARVKAGQKAGYPRFKPRPRYDSLTYPSWGDGCALRQSGRLYLQGVGDLKVKWHRALPTEATIKTVSLKREAGHWYVCFSLDGVAPNPLPACDRAVGIDVGLSSFATLSDGQHVENPRRYRNGQAQLRRAQRQVARGKRGSHRRKKAVFHLQSVHAHIRNQRADFLHKTARTLVEENGLIAVEDLNVQGLAGGMLAKSVHDASWGQFLQHLNDKAEEAGRLVIAVNPSGTTQDCSGCGEPVPKGLGDRWHLCPACGLSLDRDENAARNILQRARGQGPGWGLQAPTVGVARAVA